MTEKPLTPKTQQEAKPALMSLAGNFKFWLQVLALTLVLVGIKFLLLIDYYGFSSLFEGRLGFVEADFVMTLPLAWGLLQFLNLRQVVASMSQQLVALRQAKVATTGQAAPVQKQHEPSMHATALSSSLAVMPEVTMSDAIAAHVETVPVVASSSALASAMTAKEAVVTHQNPSPSVANKAPPVRRKSTQAPLPPKPSLFDEAVRWFSSGNSIVKIGGLVLFFGLLFLAKYMNDTYEVSIEARLVTIAFFGMGLLGVGFWQRQIRPAPALMIQGLGIAVLYLVLFTAWKFYTLLPWGACFVLMLMVSVLSAFLAIFQNAKSLSVIGALGGFAVPILLSTGSGNYVGLLSYYFVLTVGIAIISWFYNWRELVLIGYGFTVTVMAFWGFSQYTKSDFWGCQLFLIAFFLLYVFILVMPVLRVGQESISPAEPEKSSNQQRTSRGQKSSAGQWINATLLFSLPTVAFLFEYGLVRHYHYAVAFACLFFGLFYLGLAWWLKSRHAVVAQQLFSGVLAVALVFTVLIVPFALNERMMGGAWALQGAGLIWLGFLQRRSLVRWFGYGATLLAGIMVVYGWIIYAQSMKDAVGMTRYVNGFSMSALLLLVGSFLSAYWVYRFTSKAQQTAKGGLLESYFEPLLMAWGLVLSSVTILMHQSYWLPHIKLIAAGFSYFLILFAIFGVIAKKWQWPKLSQLCMGLAPVMAVVLWIAFDTQRDSSGHLLSPFFNVNTAMGWTWLAAFILHAIQCRWALHQKLPAWPKLGLEVNQVLAGLVLSGLGSMQGAVWMQALGGPSSSWVWLGWFVIPLMLVWLVLSPKTQKIPWMHNVGQVYSIYCVGLTLLGLLRWSFIANIASDGSATPLPYCPFLNPLDLAMMLLFATTVYWYQRFGRSAISLAFDGHPTMGDKLVYGSLALLIFFWLSCVLVRSFHHYANIPYDFVSMSNSPKVQTGLTLLWSVIAVSVMGWSSRKGLRSVWISGGVLLAVVVVKLLLVDLAATGTLMRVVSFIGVGVLMLVIGLFAPIPSKEAPTTESLKP